MVTQLLRVLSNYYSGLSLGIELSLLLYLVFIPVIGIAVSLPISISGIGLREYISIELFGQFTQPEKAMVMQTLAYLGTLFINSLGFFVIFYDWFIEKKTTKI
jgi:hypothetical protein